VVVQLANLQLDGCIQLMIAISGQYRVLDC